MTKEVLQNKKPKNPKKAPEKNNLTQTKPYNATSKQARQKNFNPNTQCFSVQSKSTYMFSSIIIFPLIYSKGS